MRFFGHRGAAGLALENSKQSILASLQTPVAAIEVDVRLTRDGNLVLIHDYMTGRIADQDLAVRSATLAELKAVQLTNGERLLTIEELFNLVGNAKPIMIDMKDAGCAEALLDVMGSYPNVTVYVTSFIHDKLTTIHTLRPDIPTYILEHHSPFDIIHTARRLKATGISLNMWLMNPLTYRLAQRYNLELLVYTVNSPWLMRFFQKLYPNVTLYTDHPERIPAKIL